MKVTTDKGTVMDALWMEGPTLADGTVWMKLQTDMPLYKVAETFETAAWIQRDADGQREATTFENLRLTQVQRQKGGTVFLQFET